MKSSHLRIAFVTLSVVVQLLFALVPTAGADQPFRQDIPFEPFFNEACGFEVLVESLTNKEVLTTFFDTEGNVTFLLVTGPLKVRLTNTSTDKSVDLNVSGPVRIEPQPDGALTIFNVGPTLIFFEPDVAPDLPRIALIHGRSESEIDAEGNFTLLSVQGQVEDICAVLADP